MDDYKSDVSTYNSKVSTIKTENEKVRELNWWEIALGVEQAELEEFPLYIGEYDGPSMQNTGTQGGYGDATSGNYVIATGNKLSWGVYGQSTDTNLNMDIDKTLSTPRYLLISLISNAHVVT
jgi:hypothetical protein